MTLMAATVAEASPNVLGTLSYSGGHLRNIRLLAVVAMVAITVLR